jgi:hypothetical protein
VQINNKTHGIAVGFFFLNIYRKQPIMSTERIKEIMQNMDKQKEPLNEAVTLSQHDFKRLKSLDAPIRQKIMGKLGKFDATANKVQSNYNDFFNDKEGPKVDYERDGDAITGDEKFKDLYSEVENQDEVITFFKGMRDTVSSLHLSGFLFDDVSVSRSGKVYVHLQYMTDTLFFTKKGEFEFTVSPISIGSSVCRVKSIDIGGWLNTKPPAHQRRFLTAFNASSTVSHVLTAPITTGTTAYFK